VASSGGTARCSAPSRGTVASALILFFLARLAPRRTYRRAPKPTNWNCVSRSIYPRRVGRRDRPISRAHAAPYSRIPRPPRCVDARPVLRGTALRVARPVTPYRIRPTLPTRALANFRRPRPHFLARGFSIATPSPSPSPSPNTRPVRSFRCGCARRSRRRPNTNRRCWFVSVSPLASRKMA